MSKLITKNGQTVQALAAHFMLMNVGERIPRVEDFSNLLEVGRGTIQTALGFLCANGAIQLKANGHLGTKLTYIDKKSLWAIAGFSNMLGIMPLPYSKCYEGLATALCEVFEQAEVPFALAHQRGSESRIAGVINGRYDFAVCSRLSAEFATQKNKELDIIVSLGSHTFVGGHALILRSNLSREITDGMRVAVDPSSIDQVLMTEQLAAHKSIETVHCPYNQVADMLCSNLIDATIWNADEFEEKFSNLDCIKIDLPASHLHDSTEAVLVAKKENRHLKMMIQEVVTPQKIQEIQRLVLENKKLPKY